MVTAIVNISEDANRVLNMVKAKYSLRDKSEAINQMAIEYSEDILDLPLRPEFVARLRRIKKQKGKLYHSVEELRRDIEGNARVRDKA